MAEVSILIYILGGIALVLVVFIILMVKRPGAKAEKSVKEMFDKRKSISEVLSYARLKKWKEKEVKLYYLLFSMKNFKDNGYGVEEIKSMAEDSGWPRDLVDIVMKKLG